MTGTNKNAIRIFNATNAGITWLVYNHHDPEKDVPLATGTLGAGLQDDYEPPANIDGLYAVAFEHQETTFIITRRLERGVGTAPLGYMVSLIERDGLYETWAEKR